jgi:hypothetical protein
MLLLLSYCPTASAISIFTMPKPMYSKMSARELHLGAVNMTALVWLVSEYGL